MHLKLPENYQSKLTVRETEAAIRYIRETFQDEFGQEMNLERLSAPMFVEQKTGLNDNLNGIEQPVSFTMADLGDERLEIVHSLAKWKRFALKRYGFGLHEGLYTNMNAIRKDEDLDNCHSAYVDQWDWEKVISREERNLETLKTTVRKIFKVIKHMEHEVWYKYPQSVHRLPEEIHFISTQELEDRYPELSPTERENEIAKELGAVFLMKIGGALKSGKRHDGRAPDYDDWELNGDIIFWYEPLQQALEVSSMGIRVDRDSLQRQLKIAGAQDRLQLPYHQLVLNEDIPFTIGGGIGQSRLCMLLLGKVHVGEVQAAVWPKEMVDQCESHGIHLL